MTTIIFIHGMFMTPKSWKNWQAYFTALGYHCIAPAWPLHDAEPATLRANPPAGTGDLTLTEVMAEMEKTIDACESAPVVVGHSIGGLIAQVLLNRGKVAAAVAISSVAPNAMLSFDMNFLKSTVPILNPLEGDSLHEMTPEGFHETFANVLSEQDSLSGYEAFAVHESRNVLRSALGAAGHVKFELPHNPLLFLTGNKDHIIPEALVQKNFDAYPAEKGIKAIEVFDGMGHFICNEPGWKKVASAAANWLQQAVPVPDAHVEDAIVVETR